MIGAEEGQEVLSGLGRVPSDVVNTTAKEGPRLRVRYAPPGPRPPFCRVQPR